MTPEQICGRSAKAAADKANGLGLRRRSGPPWQGVAKKWRKVCWARWIRERPANAEKANRAEDADLLAKSCCGV